MGKKMDNKDVIIILLVLLCLYQYFNRNSFEGYQGSGAILNDIIEGDVQDFEPDIIDELIQMMEEDQEEAAAAEASTPPECTGKDGVSNNQRSTCEGHESSGACGDDPNCLWH